MNEQHTTADLLLAASVKEVAIQHRNAAIRQAVANDPQGREFSAIESTWDKSPADYLQSAIDELQQISDMVRERLREAPGR